MARPETQQVTLMSRDGRELATLTELNQKLVALAEARRATVEELIVRVDDFRPVDGAPRIAIGTPGFQTKVIGAAIPPQPSARYWALLEGDAIEAELPISGGDRVVSLETDIEMELGFLRLDLVEHARPGAVPLLTITDQSAAAKRPFPVRRTIEPESRVSLRIAAQTTDSGHPRRVFGCYVRIARAS
jgi:hypothetical protein